MGVSSVGGSFVIASPEGYQLDPATLDAAGQRAARMDAPAPRTTTDPQDAVSNADVVYTDVWISMGDETERGARIKAFEGFTVDPELLSLAKE